MVVTMNKSDAKTINNALAAIEQVGANVIGVIANGISSKGKGAKGAYTYTYGYYHTHSNNSK
jgi:Mrp family chromosome partitioning ATPase